MKKIGIFLFIILLIGLLLYPVTQTKEEEKTGVEIEETQLNGLVLKTSENKITIQDENNIIYTFETTPKDIAVGDSITLKYEGTLNKNQEYQTIEITSLKKQEEPLKLNPNDMFGSYYDVAEEKLATMNLSEKIAQLLLVRYPDTKEQEITKQYQFGGYVFFAKDFKGKNKEQVQTMIQNLQNVSKIPLLTAVDEEGGTVVRISSNPLLRKEKFASSQELYQEGGFERIKEDTIEKSKLLKELGINLNLAPVVDVSENPDDYMYKRSFGQNTELTSTYAETVINSSKGLGVSYTLKHFPGYGNNTDTHNDVSIDDRSLNSILEKDLPPFASGIEAGSEAVLVSHNLVSAIDEENIASLSPSIHNLLRNELSFSGIVITDDLAMGAVENTETSCVNAILAGNDLLIVTDYKTCFNAINVAVQKSQISESLIDKLVTRVIAWKFYKGLLE